ncbi:hypothetical protein QYE76_042718 [Lolium multiflorum]|uniref:Integrase catalytic domain-containing protein n=1 Tax=Lolium multiflorum TaxID=4521 RepID=A0AAD8WV59_LOLMU|nr:hypothetical protein QYE76_042718 [Lolium multiflorum]
MEAKHDEGWLWHRRLGHVNMRNLKQLLKGEHIVGLTGISFEKDRVCSACVAGKQLKKKHPIKSIVTTSRPLELLHLDLFGPSHYDTLGGSKYGLVIVDDYSRYSWVFLLKSKDETHREFITFAKKAQRTYESEIKAIRTDNGTEFKNYTMQEFVDDEGIKHEFSAPYTPQQNGVVERKNRTIIEMARTMLSEFNSPHNFWGEAISTAVHYSNRLFLRPLHNKTPYELLTGNKPNVMYIRVFGCKCLVKNNKGKLGKFETRTIEGIFVGYAEKSHAYRYYNRSTGTIEVSCDVVFLEDNGSQVEQVVPCVAGIDDDPSSAIKHMGIGHIRPMEAHNDDQDDGVEVSSSPQVEPSSPQVEPSSTQVEPSSATQDLSSTQDESHSEEQEESPQPTEQDHDDDQETSSTHVQAQVVPHVQALARYEFIDHEGTIRKIKAATRASDMKVDQVLGSISRGVVTRRHHALLITYCQHHAFVSSFEPLKVHEALVDPDWVIAMQEELECFTRNEVWSLVERPKDHRINVIGTKWVFKNKQDENGIVIRNKARLVAQGFAQIEGGSSDDDRGSPAKRGRLAPRPPGCRTSTRKPSKAPQPTDTGSSARVRNKSVANRKKDKHAAQEDDEIVPDFNIADANRLEWQDLRTVNPYRYEQRTYTGGDKFFWTKTQAALWDGFYNTQECMKNGAVVKPKAINPEELALHEATKYRFVVETLKAMDRMTPNYAQYVQRLINYIVPAPLNTLEERVIMAPFKFPTQEGRPEIPSMMPSNERRSKEHHDPAASSSYSRRPKHGAARFFSSMWQMCKNTNDVAHQSLALNQETRRRQNEFMATRNVPVPPSGPEMEPMVAPQWEMPPLTDEMIQNFDFSMYAHGGLPPRTARAPTPTDDGGDEDEGDAATRDEGESSYSSGHEFY